MRPRGGSRSVSGLYSRGAIRCAPLSDIGGPRNKTKRSILSLMLVRTTFALSACHTMAGVGEDVQEVGEEVEETAEGR